MERTLKILYPIVLLKPGPELIDPDNTETIWEYYLLENLSCGLVRDSKFSPSGYEGCIAEQFYQIDSKTWAFKIRELHWSDGSPITDEDFINWLENLRSSHKRHIRFLRLADKISFDKGDRILKIRFPFKMDSTLLHELSLADSGLIPDNYKLEGWKKTVGPYSVETWDGVSLILKANKNSPLFSNEMPQKASLFKLQDPTTRSQLFRNIPVDIVPVSATSNPKAVSEMLPNAPQIWSSHPMSISFFVFNKKNRLSHKIETRLQIGEIFHELRQKIANSSQVLPLLPESQLIPYGFSGRFDAIETKKRVHLDLPEELELELFSSFRDFPSFLEAIKSEFKKYNVEIKFSFTDKSTLQFQNNEIGGIYGFLGNQMDATGTWSFLIGPPAGPLSPWLELFKSEYESVFDNSRLESRKDNIVLLHKKVLDSYCAIPLVVGPQRYLLSAGIDASRLNQLDSRLRIYELRWK